MNVKDVKQIINIITQNIRYWSNSLVFNIPPDISARYYQYTLLTLAMFIKPLLMARYDVALSLNTKCGQNWPHFFIFR